MLSLMFPQQSYLPASPPIQLIMAERLSGDDKSETRSEGGPIIKEKGAKCSPELLQMFGYKPQLHSA